MAAETILFYLVTVSLRALVLATFAGLGLAVFRVRSAASRHAIWTSVTAGVLLLMILNPVLPSVRVPISFGDRAQPQPVSVDNSAPAPVPRNPSQRTDRPWWETRWKQSLVAGYAAIALFFLTQLMIGYGLTVRLAQRSRKVVLECSSAELYESDDISVPIALGIRRPRILLPRTWPDWDATKCRSVIAHEEAHVQRADGAILLSAAFLRCVLWFHPLNWWLERNLASLAEQACDDRALLATGDREGYALALLDMAQSVRAKQGRLVWEGIAMAKETQVKKRIDQILDESRHISGAWSPARWFALLALSVPPVYLLTAVQLVPAQAQTETAEAADRYQTWLKQVSYMIAAPEKTAFNSLQTDAERDRFIEQFWEQRNPTPGAANNPFKEEFYRRVAFVNEHYSTDLPGWNTDRGRIYIRYGPPDEIESHPAPPAHEDWRYHHVEGADNLDFHFVDLNQDGNYKVMGKGVAIQESGFGISGSPATPGAPQRIRVGQNVQAANLIAKLDPVYPPLAQQARIQGTVRFTVIIGKDGHVSNIQLVSGHPILVQAAMDAVRQWVYKPTLLNGDAVEVMTQADVNFTLP